jgi:hypothetical protein
MSDLAKSATNHEVENLEKTNAPFDAESQKEQQVTKTEMPKTNKQGLTLVPQPSDDPRDPLVSRERLLIHTYSTRH